MKEVRSAQGKPRLRLETWGEIANHLGVEVRTAQRWEARMGLPVRRLDGSLAVFAFADELDDWRTNREVKPAEPKPVAPPESTGDQATAPKPTTGMAQPSWGWVAVAITAAALVALMTLRSPLRVERLPAALAVEGSRLVATDGTGAGVWTHDFGAPVSIIHTGFRPELRKWWQVVDIEGDGRDEVVVVLSHLGSGGEPYDVLHCFEAGGALRYSYTPKLTLSFRAGQYAGPWVFWDVEHVPQAKALWLAFEHSPWWPSGIIALDPAGQATLRYVQPGSVKVLRTMVEGGRPLVLAAGVNNEYGAASLALLDPSAPPASAPQTATSQFTCLDCPAGRPLKYVLLPASPFNAADGLPYNRVEALSVGDELRLQTYEAENAAMIYQLTRAMVVKAAVPSDTYWTSRPRHALRWPPEPVGALSLDVRTWEQGRWTTTTLPYAGPVSSPRLATGSP
jgi:hypothetical protein